ncbi:MAG: ankyrin repeat domain-containing protein [Wolbachia pipientis]|jgi:ankyrin repeat protein|nr:ankyrin repeat domain-containing protein [Wolbachia pipientis]
MIFDDFIKMLAEINDLSDLNENNIIERIKTKLEENDLRRWENSEFDIDHIFTSDLDPVKATLLHFAAEGGYENIVGALIVRGANVNAQNNYGWTPLHLAVECGCKDVVRFLLDNAKPRAEMEVESAEQVAPARKLELS